MCGFSDNKYAYQCAEGGNRSNFIRRITSVAESEAGTSLSHRRVVGGEPTVFPDTFIGAYGYGLNKVGNRRAVSLVSAFLLGGIVVIVILQRIVKTVLNINA